MYLARVTGTVVATQKVDGLDGVRLLVVERVDDEGNRVGEAMVAADAVKAGVGELVYVCTGREASMALDEPFVPVDLAVVGHVDDVNVAGFALAEGRPSAKPRAKSRARGAAKRPAGKAKARARTRSSRRR